MDLAELEVASHLFDAPARCHALSVGSQDLEQLIPLADDEVDPNYPRWVEKRRREYRAGRHAAKQVCATLGGNSPAIQRDSDGVPRFPEGMAGSISHTGRETILACAVAQWGARGVGIDVEERKHLGADLKDHIASPIEIEFASEVLTEADTLICLFAAKEAFYKCVYPTERRFFSFRDVSLRAIAEQPLGAQLSAFQVTLERNAASALCTALTGRLVISKCFVWAGFVWP